MSDESRKSRTTALNLAGSSEFPAPSSGDMIAIVHATLYVGDQLARIADVLEDVKGGRSGGLGGIQHFIRTGDVR